MAALTLTATVQLPAARRNKEGSMPSPSVEKEAVWESASPHKTGRSQSAAGGGEYFQFDFEEILYMGTRNGIYSERKEGVCS